MSLSLRSLSDADILSRTRALASRERALTLRLLLHLNEIEQRKLHLKQGYSSMFDYCTSGLRYSEPAAVRRICAARCVARFPEVYALLEANEVTLSTMSRVARVLKADNKDALLTRIRGRSQREVDAIVAEYQPRTMLRDVVRPVVFRVPVAPAASDSSGAPVATGLRARGASPPVGVLAPANAVMSSSSASQSLTTDAARAVDDACERSAYRRSDGDFHPAGCRRPSEAFVTEKRIQFQFAASETFQAKLEKTKSLAWHRLPANPSLEQVFELALDCFIEKHDPRARHERRRERASKPEAPERKAGVARQAGDGSRYVAAAARDEVFARDGDQCAFVSPNGRRCAARTALQVDHIRPVARGGTSTVDNLRLLCAYHNRFEAERMMGPLARRRSLELRE